MTAEAFYLPVRAGVFRATEHTIGPWSDSEQHAGPPSALLVRAIEQVLPAAGLLARVSVDLLSAVPVGEVEVRARLVRPGRTVALVEAELDAGGRVAARATAWWHRLEDTAAVVTPPAAAPPMPAEPEDDSWTWGYLQAMDWRWSEGHFLARGPATVWTRMRYPLLPDEQPSPTQRVLVTADSGNGVSNLLDMGDWLFINTELTVHFVRAAAGEWVCLAAQTLLGDTGAGLATSRLYDRVGEVARGAQALVVRPRR